MNLHDKTIKRSEVTTGPLTGSRKVYSAPEGHDDLAVPFREIDLTNGASFRALLTWIARASRPLPVPVSPWSSTVASVCAARPIMSYTAPIAGEFPMTWLKRPRSVRPRWASSPRSVV